MTVWFSVMLNDQMTLYAEKKEESAVTGDLSRRY